ncbi:hypothetical protein WV31_14510 [Magnetospirillum sp. ME-1]|nr:hypothetical protein WV31_14510 [Magnetospirillum sp. ME-1]
MVAPSMQEHMTRDQSGIVVTKIQAMCPSCERQWFITPDREIRAWVGTDRKVWITGGMMNMLRTPDEFAFIFAHETAHIALNHEKDVVPAHRVGQLVGMLILEPDYGSYVARSFVQPSLEMEADRQAVQWMTMAGYDARAALDVVRRLDKGGGGTHPDTADRLRNLERAIAENRRVVAPAPVPVPAPAKEIKLMKGSGKIVENWP